MSRIVLIHGFATGIGYSIFRPAYGADAGFSAFRDDIDSGKAKAFRWDIKEQASFWQALNPFYTWNIYQREKAIAKDRKTYRRLAEFLAQEQPEVIVCHSMGCFLLSEYLKHESLPSSVRHIVFNQADLPRTALDDFKNKALITNTYCFWDLTLWFSAVFQGSLLAGLLGMQHPEIQNRFLPLLKPINLHAAAIRSRYFRDYVSRLLAL